MVIMFSGAVSSVLGQGWDAFSSSLLDPGVVSHSPFPCLHRPVLVLGKPPAEPEIAVQGVPGSRLLTKKGLEEKVA